MQMLTLLAMFAIMFLFNRLTLKLADDYQYAFSFATNERLTRFGDIFESLLEHGRGVNGRYFGHFFTQLFLMLPDIVFDILNSFVFVTTIFLVYKLSNGQKDTNNLFLLAIFGAVFLFEHNFGQINLWLDGSCNYLFAVFFGLLFLLPFLQSLIRHKQIHPVLILPHMCVSIILGGYLEPLSVGVMLSAGLMTIVDIFHFHHRRAWALLPSLICSAVGLAIMVFAPAETVNKLADFSAKNLLETIGVSLLVSLSISPLIVLFVILIKRTKKEEADPRLRYAAIILAIGAAASNFILLIAKHYPLRCSVACVFLFIFATSLLYGNIQNRNFGRKTVFVQKLITVVVCLALIACFVDNLYTFTVFNRNEHILTEAAKNRDTSVELTIPPAFTKYNSLSGITYLDTENPQEWPNIYVAKYYGLDSVIGRNGKLKGVLWW